MNQFELKLKALPVRQPSAGYCERVLAGRPAARPPVRSFRGRQVWLLLPAAAAILAVLALGAAVYWYKGGAGPAAERASSGANGPADGDAHAAQGGGRLGQAAAPGQNLERQEAGPRAGNPATSVVRADLAGPVFSEGLAAVTGLAAAGQYRFGYIDHAGKWVIPPKFSLAVRFEQGIARVYDAQQGPFYFINHQGQPVAAETAEQIVKGRARPAIRPAEGKVERSGSDAGQTRCGFVDQDGKFVIPPQYDQAADFSEGLARVCVESKWGFIDCTGTLVIPPQFASVGDFSEGLAAAQLTKQQAQAAGAKPDLLGSVPWGYIDRSGQFVMPPQFGRAVSFSEGLAYVQGEGIDGFIDHTGKLVIDVAKVRKETVIDMGKPKRNVRGETATD